MKTSAPLLMLLTVLALPSTGMGKDLSVHIDFPGGSAEVESIDQQKRSVRLMPSDHPGRGWRCWWYFRLEGLGAGETLSLDVGEAPWATPDQAAFSADGRRSWGQTARGKRKGKRIVYQYTAKTEGPHWFAWGPPFVLADAHAVIQRARKEGGDWAEPFVLTKSREGRDLPSIRIREAKNPAIGIWIQARQHAWESGSSWVCRGFLEWLVSPGAAALRQQAEIVVTPIMDIDNVELGAGGKSQQPWDHNRDWREKPHWPEVAAAQEGIRALQKEGRLQLFVDLHNPGANDREAYFYITPRDLLSPKGQGNLNAFIADVKERITGPIPFRGKSIESGAKYDAKNWRYISKNWVSNLAHDSGAVAVTLETGWNTPGSHCEGYRTVGRQLGQAIQQYVQGLVGQKVEGGLR